MSQNELQSHPTLKKHSILRNILKAKIKVKLHLWNNSLISKSLNPKYI